MKRTLIMLSVIGMIVLLLSSGANAGGTSSNIGKLNLPGLAVQDPVKSYKINPFDYDISKYNVIYVKSDSVEGKEVMELRVLGPIPASVHGVQPYYRLKEDSAVEQVAGSYDCKIENKRFICNFTIPMGCFDSPTELIIVEKGATMRNWTTKPHAPPLFLSEGIYWLTAIAEAGARLNIFKDDRDGDGIKNNVDNCILKSNEDQRDIDGDSRGDLCDNDIDHDGLINDRDNCKFVKNPDQADRDNDDRGDKCQFEFSGISSSLNIGSIYIDPCLFNPEGEACKEKGGDGVNPDDLDGDGVLNEDDKCPEEKEKYTIYSLTRPVDGVLDGCPNSPSDSNKVTEANLGDDVTIGEGDASDGGGGCSLTSSKTNFIALALMILALIPIAIRRRRAAYCRE